MVWGIIIDKDISDDVIKMKRAGDSFKFYVGRRNIDVISAYASQKD